MNYPRFPRFVEAVLGTIVFAFFAPSILLAEGPAAPRGGKPLEHPAVTKTAAVRFWKTDLSTFSNVRVAVASTGERHDMGREIGSGGPGYQFGNYQQVPAGKCRLALFVTSGSTVSKAPAQSLSNLTAEFPAGTFFTVLVTEGTNAGDPPQMVVIEDARSDEKTASNLAQITIRSFVPALKGVHVKVGDVLNTQFASGAGFLVMRGVQSAVYQVHTSGTAPDGKTFDWDNEVDLKQNHRQTLLIYPDPYGRIRPRLSVDGEMLAEAGGGDRQR